MKNWLPRSQQLCALRQADDVLGNPHLESSQAHRVFIKPIPQKPPVEMQLPWPRSENLAVGLCPSACASDAHHAAIPAATKADEDARCKYPFQCCLDCVRDLFQLRPRLVRPLHPPLQDQASSTCTVGNWLKGPADLWRVGGVPTPGLLCLAVVSSPCKNAATKLVLRWISLVTFCRRRLEVASTSRLAWSRTSNIPSEAGL